METEIYNEIYKLQTEGWWFGNGRNKLVIELLSDICPSLEKKKILDVGCSEGAFLDCLKKEKSDFRAIDIDKNAIEFCKKRGFKDRVKEGSILDIPFKDNSFDIVTALDVVEHVEDDVKAMRELARVAKKGGTVFVILPAHPWLWSKNDEAYHHHRRYDLDMVKKLVAKTYLRIEAITYFNVLLFPVFVLATLATKLSASKGSNVVKPVPRPINSVLSGIMNVERTILKKRLREEPGRLPGSSFIVILKKK